MSGEDILNLGFKLYEEAKKDDDEVKARSAFSRIYYGLFHILKDKLLSSNLDRGKIRDLMKASDEITAKAENLNIHQALIKSIHNFKPVVAVRLRKLRAIRNHSDYNIKDSIITNGLEIQYIENRQEMKSKYDDLEEIFDDVKTVISQSKKLIKDNFK